MRRKKTDQHVLVNYESENDSFFDRYLVKEEEEEVLRDCLEDEELDTINQDEDEQEE
jgi:hypothetical protein